MSRAYSKKVAENALKNSETFDLGEHDVLVGKGRGAYLSKGNQRYMELISFYAEKHRDAPTNVEKIQITNQVIETVTKRGGRFLAVDESGRLVRVSEKQARVKVGQALRHKRRKLPRRDGESSSIEGSTSSNCLDHSETSVNPEPAVSDFFLDMSSCPTLGFFHPVEGNNSFEMMNDHDDDPTFCSLRAVPGSAASSLSSVAAPVAYVDPELEPSPIPEAGSAFQNESFHVPSFQTHQFDESALSLQPDLQSSEPSFPTESALEPSKILLQSYTPHQHTDGASSSALMPSLEELMRNKGRFDMMDNQTNDL
eukprot:CAMPEP_0168738960 /NCGR_PEP_ID=MMETSP0724-20121128/11207_1 /TAXON_ID=265536 /ORGANISM="Amphiprora sp., Strain CCMP467" /LENGTH=310 /DNA_ID=CAMNT_0008786329 /DNA_START=105 /DNA_END=1037 /DNA_ORIENTATION=+